MVDRPIEVRAQYLEEGMIVARDVEKDNRLLVGSGAKLTRKMIFQIIQSRIPYVWIYDNTNTDNLKLYTKNYDHFRNIITSAAQNEPIKMKEVKSIVQGYADVRSQRALLRYIYGIRKADEYTYQHSLNVSYIAMMLGKWAGFDDLDALAEAGLLHDLGKTKIDNAVLNKPGPLNDEEWGQMRRHPYYGYHLLLDSPEVPKRVLLGVLSHHERMNGTGYPQGLKSEDIPEIARIISIADVFDAMASDRVYRGKQDVFEVLQFMHNRFGEFDLKYLRIFTENMLEILVGEEVLLSNQKVGKIVFTNQYRPFAPLIQTEDGFLDLAQETHIKVERVLA